MASVLHGCARTTPRVRAELQASQAPIRALAVRYGLNPKTVARSRKRTTVEEAPVGPRQPRPAALGEADEARVVKARSRGTPSLDGLLGSLREGLPRLSRSAPRSKRERLAETEIGYLRVDAAETRAAEGKAHVFLAAGAQERGIRLEVVRLPEAKRGFVLLPRRWVVERSFAWSSRFKRLAKDHERLPETLAEFHVLAFRTLMLAALGDWTRGA